MPDSIKGPPSTSQRPDDVVASTIIIDQSHTSRVPDEVIASNILIHLPLRQMIQLRTLSKSMNELLHCKSLLQKWRSTTDCWLLMAKVLPSVRPKQVFSPLVAYNIFDENVHDKSFPMPLNNSLLPSLISSLMQSLSKVKEIASVNLVASAGGLICALILGEQGMLDDYSLLIFNPLTGSHKTLPKPPKNSIKDFASFTLSMVTKRASDDRRHRPSYYVILHSEKFKLDIYDSATKEWKRVDRHLSTSLGDIRCADVIFHAYTLEEESETILLGYNIDRQEWYNDFPQDNDLEDEVFYIRHRGQLFMVGGMSSTAPMTRGRTSRLSSLFRLKPERGWVRETSLNHKSPHKKCPHHDPFRAPRSDGDLEFLPGSLHYTRLKRSHKVRSQFHIGPLGTVPTHSSCPCISSEWLKLLSSPLPPYAPLCLYVPSFAAKP